MGGPLPVSNPDPVDTHSFVICSRKLLSKQLQSNSSTPISWPRQRRLYPETLQPTRAILVVQTTSKISNVTKFAKTPNTRRMTLIIPPRINTQRPSSNLWRKRCLQRTLGPLASFTSGCAPSELLPAPFVCKTRCVLRSCI